MALRRLAPARQAPEQQRAWQRLDGPGSVPYSTIAKRPYGLRATCRDTTGHSASFLLRQEPQRAVACRLSCQIRLNM
jgi:hypothetical protein